MSVLQVYDNQRVAAWQLVNKFKEGLHYGILCCPPQGGKTGVGRETALMVRALLGFRIILVCGMNYLNLKHQAIKEFLGVVDPDDVLFSKDLESFTNRQGTIQPNFENCLIIIDESHFAQDAVGKTKKISEEERIEGLPSLIHRFFTKHVGVTLDGQKQKWKANNVKILSISATPMSEVAHLDYPDEECPKKIVQLIPGQGYYGFERMLELGRIKKAFNLNKVEELERLVLKLKSLNDHQTETDDYKYALLRFNNNKKGKKTQEEFYRLLEKYNLRTQVRILKFYHKEMDIQNINEYLDDKPKEFTIVIIYHSLRAGIQVNTSHICLVHESHSAATDVTAQGLPGRCCGYNKEDHKVEIYCNMKSIRRYIEWSKNGFDPRFIPPKAKNIKTSLQSERISHFEPNKLIGVRLPDSLIHQITEYRRRNRRYRDIWTMFGSQIRELLQDQADEDFWNTYNYVSSMILNGDNEQSSWHSFWEVPWNAFQEGRAIRAFRDVALPEDIGDHLFFVYFNLKEDDPQYGWVLIPSKSRIDIDTMYTQTTKKEQYHPDNNPDLNMILEEEEEIDLDIGAEQNIILQSASLGGINIPVSRLRNLFNKDKNKPNRPVLHLKFVNIKKKDEVGNSSVERPKITVRFNGELLTQRSPTVNYS